jgi:pimeloyl-ACP methyl ester carboxylesterase
MRRLVAAIAALLLTGGLVDAASAQAGTARSTHSGNATAAAGYTPPPINWTTCSDPTLAHFGAQCGMMVVPMNYARPNGPKIEIAVSRRLHKSSHYQGVMLVNPGGPGGSGLIYGVLPDLVTIPGGAADDYDWIGFDPRGVGSSVPSISCNPAFFTAGARPQYQPTTPKIERQWVVRSKAYAADCAGAKGHALLNHVRTVDSVNDMESIRKALHQSQINYYGFSYGTYLGSVYATLHPNRVRRFVFDSTVNPRRVFYKDNQDQDRAFQKTFDVYLHWLAKYHSVYNVGNTYQAVRAKYLATVAKLDKHHAAQGQLGGDELIDVFTSAGYYVYGWEDIGQAYSDYINKGDPTALLAMYTSANPTTTGGDNGYAMYLATQCTDARWPRNQAKLDRDNTRLNRNYNYFTWANAWFNGPCAYWHFKAHQPVHVTGRKVTVPVLMIDETLDPATPFPGSLLVRKLFPTASLIEGKNGTTHAGSLSGVACTDDSIGAYLANGTVPARKPGNRSDKVCPPVPQPNPTAVTPSNRVATGGGALIDVLRTTRR